MIGSFFASLSFLGYVNGYMKKAPRELTGISVVRGSNAKIVGMIFVLGPSDRLFK
jgi:hypothetical protein